MFRSLYSRHYPIEPQIAALLIIFILYGRNCRNIFLEMEWILAAKEMFFYRITTRIQETEHVSNGKF